MKYLFKNDFTRVRKLQKLANFRLFLSQKLQKIGTGPRVSFLNLIVYLLDYHLPLMVVLDRFEVVKKIELKIDHKLMSLATVAMDRQNCYLLFCSRNLSYLSQNLIIWQLLPFFTIKSSIVCFLVDFFLHFGQFWAKLGSFTVS